mgnify:CR=1 FL=1
MSETPPPIDRLPDERARAGRPMAKPGILDITPYKPCKAKAAGIETCVFDRGGYQYHGRVKALADGAREGGLAF